jgi:hypothetical protein
MSTDNTTTPSSIRQQFIAALMPFKMNTFMCNDDAITFDDKSASFSLFAASCYSFTDGIIRLSDGAAVKLQELCRTWTNSGRWMLETSSTFGVDPRVSLLNTHCVELTGTLEQMVQDSNTVGQMDRCVPHFFFHVSYMQHGGTRREHAAAGCWPADK